VYDNPDHRGRGGWSWYTGSAGWYYRVALETILGIELRGSRLTLRPRVAKQWPGFEVRLRYRTSAYTLRVEGAGGPGAAVGEVWVDGVRIEGVEVGLQDDGREHDVRFRLDQRR
jgi:cyclic beta-1,2-glucan synthetase